MNTSIDLAYEQKALLVNLACAARFEGYAEHCRVPEQRAMYLRLERAARDRAEGHRAAIVPRTTE